MNKENVRQTNLLLLRHSVFHTNQDTFAETLKVASSKLSRLELGKDLLDDSMARQIESSYKLPHGWMDRDNSNFFLSADEFDLIKRIRGLSGKQKDLMDIFNGILEVSNSNRN
jgi:hypothetical protein